MQLSIRSGCMLLGAAFVIIVLLAGCAGTPTPTPRTPQSSHGVATIKTFRPAAGSPMAGGGG
jgi:hypothetical protein